MKRTFALIAVSICLAIGCTGRQQNKIAREGGILWSTKGPYVIIDYSGSKIVDVWVLKHEFVSSEENSDGWVFITQEGNVEHVGGDAKITRLKNAADLAKWREYHFDLEGGSYVPPATATGPG